MKTLSILAVALTLGLTFSSGEAEAAKRLGSGKSSGMQRQMTAPDKAPAAAPAQAPSASTAAAKSPATAAAPQTQPKRSWMGPIAGLAAGLGLAALASHFGFGEELASMLMIGLIVMAVMVVIGLIMRKRAAAQQPALAGAGGYQFAASGLDQTAPTTRNHEPPGAVSGMAAPAATGARIPADFDAAGFARNAKVQFIRLQAANDAGNLDDIREFTTPEMFAEVKMSISERDSASQETDVVRIDAEVIEVVEEENRYVVSVRFTGLIREERSGPEEPIDEVWHLVKPREGKGGWLLAGIQQMQ